MEVGRQLIPSPPIFPSKTHLRNSPPSSVPMLHEQAASAVSSMPTTSITRHFPASVLLQEQRDEFRTLLHIKDEKISQLTLDRRQMDNASSFCEEKSISESDQYIKEFERQLLYWPGLSFSSSLGHSFPSLHPRENPLSPVSTQSTEPDTNNVEPIDVLALAKKAVVASKEAASLIEEASLFKADLDESFADLGASSPDVRTPLDKEIKVASKRLLERRSKRRRVSKPKALFLESPSYRKETKTSKANESYDPNDPLRLFLSGSETRQLLTAKEEKELFIQIQELTKLEVVKQRLQSQSGCEPTLFEWAEALGMSCRDLQSHIHSGNRSREKMTYANFRMVVHVAKHYQGRGLNLQDLLQEGSKGLMKGIEKFKPQAGCRFSTYAYWWIRQSIRKAIFQNSRTIRLPENVYNLLTQVKNAKKLCVQEGQLPTNEELAKRVGITAEKLSTLLSSTRMTLSMQQPVWADQDTTYQEITADTEVETPEMCVSKQLMRRHVRSLLNVLSPKEKRIIGLRYGIEGGKRNSLSQIGSVFGISKERVRQLENRALEKLRKCLSSHGLEAYADLLV